MRVTYGKDFVHEYVRAVYLGDDAVQEVWYEDKKLYPDEEGLVEAIDVMLPEDELTRSRWRAALASVEGGGASWKKYIRLVAGDTESRVGATHNGFPLTACTGAARNRFEFDQYSAPSFSSIQVGDEVEVEVDMTDATLPPFALGGQDASGTLDYDVPYMRDMWLEFSFFKGQKRLPAGAAVTLTGLASGTVHISSWVQANSEGRYYCLYTAKPQVAVPVASDTAFRISLTGYNSCAGLTAIPHIPSIRFVMRCRVTAVYLQQHL